MTQQPEQVSWEDVESAAEGMFNIWGNPWDDKADHAQIKWARACWKIIGKKGLTSYTSEIERTQALIRLMTLATIYCEFWHMTGVEEGHEPYYPYWADELKISDIRIGQIAGPGHEGLADDSVAHWVLRDLVERSRKETYEALIEGFGSASGLFASLWVTSEPRTNPAKLSPDRLDEILNDAEPEKCAGFQWIDQGMPNVW